MADTPFDLIHTYFPTATEITPAMLQDMRLRLVTYARIAFPDMDMRPDSVFGAYGINSFTYLLTALEEAQRRQRSDVRLSRVSQGIIYDCDFVSDFLDNWAVRDREMKQASGTVRLIFSVDAAVELDRGVRFSFESNTGSVFMPRLLKAGSLYILPVGHPRSDYRNELVLSQVSATTYAVDVPVIGQMTDPVQAQASAGLDRAVDNLVSATATHTFFPGSPPATLAYLASLAKQTAYAVGTGSRGQLVQTIRQNFPDMIGASCVLSGDVESNRGGVNALGIKIGAADLYVKSGTYQFPDVVVVKARYDPVGQRFLAKLNLPQVPVKVESIIVSGRADITIEPEILGRSISSQRANLLTCAFSKLEELWLAVPMPQLAGSPSVPLTVDADGSYALFELTYWSDPIITSASDFMDGEDFKPENCDVVVRGFVPFVFAQFEVQYVRMPGTLMTLTGARRDIAAYVNSLAPPDTFSTVRIADIMQSYGARSMHDVRINGHLSLTVATKYMRAGVVDPLVDYDTATTNSFTPYRMSVMDVNGLALTAADPNAGDQNTQQLYGVGPRNMGYWLHPDTIKFKEVACR